MTSDFYSFQALLNDESGIHGHKQYSPNFNIVWKEPPGNIGKKKAQIFTKFYILQFCEQTFNTKNNNLLFFDDNIIVI